MENLKEKPDVFFNHQKESSQLLSLGVHDASYDFKKCFKSQLDYISASKLKKLDEGDWHFVSHYILKRQNPRTEALKLGDLIHKALLRPKDFAHKYIVEPKFSGKGAKAEKESWYSFLAKDVIVISEKERDQVNGMINALQCDEYAWGLLNSATPERIIITEGRGGVPFVSIPDFFREDGLFLDFKNRAALGDDSFQKDLYNWKWWIQIGFYLIAGNQLLKKEYDDFIFILACNQIPFDTDVFPIDAETVGISRLCTEKLIDDYVAKLPLFKEAEDMVAAHELAKLEMKEPIEIYNADFRIEVALRKMFAKRKGQTPDPTGMPSWALSKLAFKYGLQYKGEMP